MDPITAAIVAALVAGVTSGLTETGKQVIVEAYGTLKAAIKKKLGGQSEVVQAVEKLEAKPDSTGRQQTLQEEVAAAHLDQDPDIRRAAQALLDQINAQPGGREYMQTVIGSYNAIVQGSGNPTVNVTPPPKEP